VGTGFFFPSGGAQLYGFLEAPRDRMRATGVLFVHGAFEERQDAHLVMRDAGERLASAGFATMRFDLFGHGDSDGEFCEATLSRWIDDTHEAARELLERSGCTRVALVGLRAGALVAAGAAARAMPDVSLDRLVLWQPVIDGRTYMMDVLRAFLAGEMTVHRRTKATRESLVARMREGHDINVNGYHLSPALFDAFCQANLASELEGSSVPVLFVDVTRAREAPLAADLAQLATRIGPRVECVTAHELQPLHSEGKHFTSHADHVVARTVSFLGACP